MILTITAFLSCVIFFCLGMFTAYIFLKKRIFNKVKDTIYENFRVVFSKLRNVEVDGLFVPRIILYVGSNKITVSRLNKDFSESFETEIPFDIILKEEND